MSLDVIKNLKNEVADLKKEIEESKSTTEKEVAKLKEELSATAERKTAFDTENEKVSDKELQRAKKLGADLHLKSIILGKPVTTLKEFKEVNAVIEKAIKPADINDWLAEEFSNQVMEELELNLQVEGLFNKIKMPDNRHTFSIPARTGDATAYLISAGDDAISSAIAGGKITFQTNRFKTLLAVTDQADQEMVSAIIDIVKQELVRSLSRASEKAIVDGDTGSDDNDVRKAFDGILKMARDAGNKVDAGGGSVTASLINDARKLLGKYGVRPSDVVLVAPVSVAYQLLELDEVMTRDKYGEKATIVTGEIAKIFGMPIVVSEYVPTDLNENGEHADDGDKTAVIFVNRSYFSVADRGNIVVETERVISSSSTMYVGYRDIDFKKVAVNATPVSAIVNVANS